MTTKWAATSIPLALAASADLTVLQVLAGSNTPMALVEVGVSFDGITAADTPFRVKVLMQTTAGSGGSAVTPRKLTRTGSPSVQASALRDFSSQPTDGDILWDGYVTPAGGRVVIQVPDDKTTIAGGERVAVRVVAPSGITTCNGMAYIHWEE